MGRVCRDPFEKPKIKRAIVARHWMWLCMGRGQVGIGVSAVLAYNTWAFRVGIN